MRRLGSRRAAGGVGDGTTANKLKATPVAELAAVGRIAAGPGSYSTFAFAS